MKYVIAGLGSIGRRHLQNLLALGEKDIILLRSNQSTLPDAELKDFPVVTSVAAALELRPGAFIISNPTSLHLDVAIPAAAAGCHILLEKPISHSLERLDQLQEALNRGGGRLLSGFHFRFHPTLQTLKRLLAEGAIGRPVAVRSHWGEYLPDWHPWEDFKRSYAARKELGGGVVLTLCHPFDYLNWLFGAPSLEWASVATRGDLGIEVEDVADADLRFPGGALGSLHLNYLQKPAVHQLTVVGTKGSARWDAADGRLSVYRLAAADWEHYAPPAGFERNALFRDEMRHFVAVARGAERPACTLADGKLALELALRTLAFSEGGKNV